jgi:preprotein translocase subunit YajC
MQIPFSFLHLAQSSLAGGGNAPAPSAPATLAQGGADAAAAGAQASPMAGGSGWETLVFFGVMILVFWLLILRPQQKKAKQHQGFLSEMRPGRTVVTASGIYGKVVKIDENVVTLEVAKDVRIRIIKSQVAGPAATPEDGGAGKDKALVEKG